MKVNFEYTKKEYKKYLLRSRIINNIILFIIGIIIYLFITDKFNMKSLIIFILVLILFIYLINKLYIVAYLKVNEMLNYQTYGKYTVEITNNKFSVTVNKCKTDYKYNSIKKVVVRKNYFKLKFKKSREYLTFERKLFNDQEYLKMIEMFKDKVK